MNQIYEKLLNCSNAVKSKVKFQPEVALILGYVYKRQSILRLKDSQFPQLQDIREDFFSDM